jgi:TRAP-type C4-dicarboxylate transport system substrate-binding protein
MKVMNSTVSIAAVAAILLAANTASARDLRAAPSLPAAHPANAILYGNMAKYLPEETNGELNFTIIGPEVVDAKGMKSALDSGLAEVGNLLPAYNPSELPNFASLGDLALLGRDAAAMSAAVTEFIVTCADCQAELTKAGLVFFGAASTDPYVLLTTKPVRTVADLKGLRLRSGGSGYARWAESVGATPVSLTLADTFEAMSQGVIDGTMTSVTDLVSMRLIDLTKYVSEVKLGTYSVSSNFTVKQSVWKEFTPEQRISFAKAAAKANAVYVQEGYLERGETARKAAREAGIEFIDPSEELVKQIRDFAISDVATAEKTALEKFKVEGAPEKYKHFQDLIAKWEKISEEANGDAQKMADARFNEIWAKVDLSTYGQ